ncbi:MAG TPA: GerMN domain-containing protein [Bacillales bacterium]|nr:GerMN domain-containing protein [Bacillales bacterium]
MNWKTSGAALIIGVPLILSGCGFGGTSQTGQSNDGGQDVNYVSPGESLKMEGDDAEDHQTTNETKQQKTATAKRTLFLLDSHGLVVPQTIALPIPEGKEVLTQALQGLVKGGPLAGQLPKGFHALLPEGTQIKGVSLKDGTATINFSESFANYEPKMEKEILQAVTWTATQFDNVKRVKLQIEGVEQSAMPVNNTPIGENGVSRADGINEQIGEVGDVIGTSAATVYFPAQAGNDYYYVPVTTRVHAENGKIAAVIERLMKGAPEANGLLDVFGSGVKLKGKPAVEDGIVTLNFNEAIYSSKESRAISEEALNALVLSLTSQEGIKKVAIMVNGKESLKSPKGEILSEPVSRPANVNTVGL